MLFVNDTDAGFMGATGNGFDVFCRFALLRELGVDLLGSFNGGLGVKFSWVAKSLAVVGAEAWERLYLGMRL